MGRWNKKKNTKLIQTRALMHGPSPKAIKWFVKDIAEKKESKRVLRNMLYLGSILALALVGACMSHTL